MVFNPLGHEIIGGRVLYLRASRNLGLFTIEGHQGLLESIAGEVGILRVKDELRGVSGTVQFELIEKFLSVAEYPRRTVAVAQVVAVFEVNVFAVFHIGVPSQGQMHLDLVPRSTDSHTT
eukprot:scaffold1690_cov182-Amphora_coffeaeformis.AAC.84